MATAEEMFKHMYDDALSHLELQRSVEDVDGPTPANTASTGFLREEYRKVLTSIIESLRMEKPDAEIVLRKGLAAMNRIERFRWLVENLLEAVKRDDSLNNSLKRYGSLGLLDECAGSLPEEKKNSPWPWNPGTGRFLGKLWDRLQRVALTVMELVVNAIKVIPKLVALKPKPSIGVSGPFPTFSLSFELEVDSITLHDLFNDLRGAHS
jgi:hypothetical protein